MASEEVEDEEARGVISEIEANGSDGGLSNKCVSENFTSKAEEYLNSDSVRFCTDPKLKREKQKLEDLLKSYKKLINKLDTKFKTEEEKIAEEKRLSKVPEIYAALHPELYRNPREDEKAKLIQKFSKRQFTAADRVVPPICRTPLINLPDKRQEEKERFIKIISSCPARFLNTCDSPLPPKNLRRPKYISTSPNIINEREAEKERLSKILATSGIYYRKHLDQKFRPIANKTCFQDRILGSDSSPSKKENMVRVGEYSPLSSKERQPTLRGFYNLDDKYSLSAGRKAIRNNLPRVNELKVDRAISTNELEEIDEDDGPNRNINHTSSRERCNSISTQTDPLDISQGKESLDSFPGKESLDTSQEKKEDSAQVNDSPRCSDIQDKFYYLSPREKLMSDLHGASHCFPGFSSKISPRGDLQDVKVRQAAYAKALQEQIEEKRKLEEERKRKEREEEELIEQRIRLQQEKIEHELSDEHKKKEDWLAQRQSHEEVLRRKMLEMELEAQELKKMERRKRRDSDNLSEARKERIAFSKPPQTTLSEPSRKPNHVEACGVDNRFDVLRLAPLLEADRQNVLSSYQRTPHPFPTTNVPMIKQNGGDYGGEDKMLDKKRAENLLKAPLDFRIDRPPSPPIPAVRTRGILNNNTKLLDNKWQVPKEGKELLRTQLGSGRDNILTQLGAFRRQLHQEHIKLEARLKKHQSP